VWALVQRGAIPSEQVGRSRRFVLEDVLSHFRVAPKPMMSVQARARRDARQIIAGQVVRRLDAQWKRRIAGGTPCQ